MALAPAAPLARKSCSAARRARCQLAGTQQRSQSSVSISSACAGRDCVNELIQCRETGETSTGRNVAVHVPGERDAGTEVRASGRPDQLVGERRALCGITLAQLVERRVTHEVSLGDFVLSGGELPALALLDAVARLQPGVLNAPSHEQDSFSDGLLEGPRYTRPEHLVVDGQTLAVPPLLLSGHHAAIARWQRERALELTARRWPDLLAAARATGRLSAEDERFLEQFLERFGSSPPL